ncbi:MAG: glutamate racemase [Ruminococcus sp.]|nr:glutamate racemase [Ruminococcus sp.]
MLDSKNPIGVFDSGMGGVSVLRELYKIMPNENYIYYGDSKNAPYGVKSTEEILNLTTASVEYLLSKNVKAVVIACNTATSAAAASLRAKYKDFPIIGLEPALKPAALSKPHPNVIVMATPLTLREKKFSDLMHRFEDEAEITKLPAPGLVELVEGDKLGTAEMHDYLEKLFFPFDKSKIDAVVLGCTHYPFARVQIQEILGDTVQIFDGGEGAARQTKNVLEQRGALNKQSGEGKITFENSDPSHIEFSKKLFAYKN